MNVPALCWMGSRTVRLSVWDAQPNQLLRGVSIRARAVSSSRAAAGAQRAQHPDTCAPLRRCCNAALGPRANARRAGSPGTAVCVLVARTWPVRVLVDAATPPPARPPVTRGHCATLHRWRWRRRRWWWRVCVWGGASSVQLPKIQHPVTRAPPDSVLTPSPLPTRSLVVVVAGHGPRAWR